MNQSLDDFIQKKFSNRRHDRGRFRNRKSGPSDNNMKGSMTGGRRKSSNSNHISDARFLIIQKKRQKLTDARDQLAQLARHSDLRSKLDRLRGDYRKEFTRSQNYLGITKQMALNGEISLKTNRLPRYPPLYTPSKDMLTTRGPLRRIVKNDVVEERQKVPAIQRTVWNDPYAAADMNWAVPYRTVRNNTDDLLRPSVKRTITDVGLSATYQVPSRHYGLSRRHQDEPVVQQQQVSSSRLLSQREEWSRRNPAKRRPPVIHSIEIEDSDSDDMMASMNGSCVAPLRINSDSTIQAIKVISNTNNSNNSSSSISSKAGGHRIVVSNLHHTVIHEDIRELFEDVGTLLDSRLVRPGTAEVVYQHLADAVKAVDLYHNRHLDGQPMKCLLVNSSMSKSASSSRSDTTAQLKLPTGTKSSIVPDVLTIHKALFNKS